MGSLVCQPLVLASSTPRKWHLLTQRGSGRGGNCWDGIEGGERVMTGSCAGLGLSPLDRGGEEPSSLCLPCLLIYSLAGEALLQTLEHRCCASQVPCWARLSQAPEPRPGLHPSPCRQHQRQAPSAPQRSRCSSLNCLQLGCIAAIMRCLRLNAVGSAGQNNRPEAWETGWSKGGGCPSWPWNPPCAPTSPSGILGPTAWILGAKA